MWIWWQDYKKDVLCQRKNVTFNQKYLSDGHCAEDVEENKRTVSVVFSQQVTMWQSLNVWERDKWELGHHSAIKAEEKHTVISSCLFGGICMFWTDKTTHMELNMPIKAVKQKPMANMDFMRTCIQKIWKTNLWNAKLEMKTNYI